MITSENNQNTNDPLEFLYKNTGHAMPTKQAEDLGDTNDNTNDGDDQ